LRCSTGYGNGHYSIPHVSLGNWGSMAMSRTDEHGGPNEVAVASVAPAEQEDAGEVCSWNPQGETAHV
jgi:hypothetical protein